MTLQTLAFLFGALLVLIGILGGGFEIKEIKIQKVPVGARIIASIVGLIFLGLAIWQPYEPTIPSRAKPIATPLPVTKTPSPTVKNEKTSENELEKPPTPSNEGPRWEWTSQRPVAENDLQGLSSKELELMRNEIYARHGWVFKRSDLQQYFGSQPWYQPKVSAAGQEAANSMAQAELTPMEKKNIQAIVSWEKSLKR